jgi:hypothetical protein
MQTRLQGAPTDRDGSDAARGKRLQADDGSRTRDLRLGKPTLYQLSYVRAVGDFRRTALRPWPKQASQRRAVRVPERRSYSAAKTMPNQRDGDCLDSPEVPPPRCLQPSGYRTVAPLFGLRRL